MNRRELMVGVGVLTVQRVALAAKRTTSHMLSQGTSREEGWDRLFAASGCRYSPGGLKDRAKCRSRAGTIGLPSLLVQSRSLHLFSESWQDGHEVSISTRVLFPSSGFRTVILGLTERFEGDMPFRFKAQSRRAFP